MFVLPLHEALVSCFRGNGCGLPVIVTDQVGALDYVVEGENGFVVAAGSVKQLADKNAFDSNRNQCKIYGDKSLALIR